MSTNLNVKNELNKNGIATYCVKTDCSNNLSLLWLRLLKEGPDYIIDDGGDLVDLAVKNKIESIKGCCEETTSGVIREFKFQKLNKLYFPVVAVNNARTKNLMDNHFGTAQSVFDGIIRATQEIIAGKRVVVCGYGNCGSGIAKRARGLGAQVFVSEIDPVKSLQAFYDGYAVGDLNKLCKDADIIITATGCIDVVDCAHLCKMKNNCVLANAGHSNCEINVEAIKNNFKLISSSDDREIFELNGRRIMLLGRGRIINLVAANGHPSEIMSLSYSSQLAGIHYLLANKLESKVNFLPSSYENDIAINHLKSKNIIIPKLSIEQKKYLFGNC